MNPVLKQKRGPNRPVRLRKAPRRAHPIRAVLQAMAPPEALPPAALMAVTVVMKRSIKGH